MTRLVRVAAIASLALALVATLLAGSVYLLALRALPDLAGSHPVRGLRDRVEVIRDAAGVPHIYAANAEDLFFAQGYVTAQDRLWQMELGRRTAWGRLSEVFGPGALEADRLFRTLGLGRAAAAEEQEIDPEGRRLLEAYSAGVNAYAASREGRLPIEFHLLFVGFEPWRPVDSLAWGKMMAWYMGGNYASELLRTVLVAKMGPERAAELMPSVPPGVVPQLAPGIDPSTLGTSVLERLDQVAGLVRPPSDALGSNNWVVSGARTKSGRPLLANDPHLGVQVPPAWYAVHLVGGGFDVAGFSLPGTPGVVVGHNGRLAWGITNVGADVQDLYVERRNPENPREFAYEGRWEEATIVREEIAVRGWLKPEALEILYTRHGPVLNADVPGEAPLALSWTALAPTRLWRSILRLNTAADWQEFRTAVADFDAPAQNFVYADREGNIGYQMSGRIPLRAMGDGLLPVPGWSAAYDWQGFIPFDSLPSAFNPPEGFIATANDRVVSADYPYLITHEWAPSFRVQRIKEMLAGKERLDVDDMRAIQADLYSSLARLLVPYALEAGQRGQAGEWGEPQAMSEKALATLANWDYVLRPGDAATTIYSVFYNRLIRRTFADELGPELFRLYLAQGRSPALAVASALVDEANPWFDDVSTPERETRDEIVWQCLEEAAGLLAGRFGAEVGDWQWGRLHTTTFAHPLGRLPLLDRLFNRGPFPRGGDASTVNVSGYSMLAPYREGHHPSLRMIVDLSDWDGALAVLPLGQSGQPLSPHYDDQMGLWLAGEYNRLGFERATVERGAAARLELVPAE